MTGPDPHAPDAAEPSTDSSSADGAEAATRPVPSPMPGPTSRSTPAPMPGPTAGPTAGPTPGPTPGATAGPAPGPARVDSAVTRAIAQLDGLSDRPLAEHPDVYQQVHETLQGALADIDDA